MAPHFTAKSLSFLRALKRNNRREWFAARKDDYDRHVRQPMVEVIEQLAGDFRRFAPELEVSPKKCLFRPYRDTRFSDDKRPLKTHAAAAFRWRGFARGEGASLYFEVAPAWVWVGGGFYAPQTSHLVRIRQHISDTYPAIHRLTRKPAFKATVGSLDGERLTRIPRGYQKDDPAADYLRYRSFLAGCEFPAAFATETQFYPTLVQTFKAVTPLVRFLNEPLGDRPRATVV